MIPQHIIDKAAHAMYLDDHPEMEFPDAPPWAQVRYEQRAKAALEAVAADIWDEGFNCGVEAHPIDGLLHETREIDLNPYRASETA